MAIESITYISDFNASNPDGATSQVAELDNHIRGMKSGIKATFPNVSGAVTPTHTELNFVDGVTSNIQTQIDTLSAGAWRKIKSQTASSSATIDFVNGVAGVVLDGTYSEYLLVIIKAIPATSGAALQLRTSTNAGVSFDATAGDYRYDTAFAAATTGAALVLTDNVYGSGPGVSGNLFFWKPSDAAQFQLMFHGVNRSGASTISEERTVGGREAATDVDGIRLMFGSGNIASGTFVLYGR